MSRSSGIHSTNGTRGGNGKNAELYESDLLAEMAAALQAERPVKPQGAVTIADLVRASGLPETTVKRHITAEVAAGRLEQVAGRPADGKVFEPATGRMVRAWRRPA